MTHSLKNAKFLLTILTLCVLLSACSSGKKEVKVDVASLASELNGCVTTDTLTQTAADMIPTIYFLSADETVSAAAYMSAGSTACEVAVIECKDEASAKDVVEKFKTRVSSQSELYASYNPGEVEKLDAAVIKSAGKYAVLAVTDDAKKAEDILKKAGF